jgi:hypothetical protein
MPPRSRGLATVNVFLPQRGSDTHLVSLDLEHAIIEQGVIKDYLPDAPSIMR